jgi:pimeloyl-ACP methyl ester carboxylesterase
VGLACSASGRICSRARTPSSSPWSASPSLRRVTRCDVSDWFDGQNVSGERLIPQTSALDARTLAGDFAVPVFVIQGAEDFTTPTSLARSFVDSIRAPAKAFIPIEEAGTSRYL